MDAIEHTIYLYDIVKTGKEEELSADVANLLGRAPRSIQDFVEDYKDTWV